MIILIPYKPPTPYTVKGVWGYMFTPIHTLQNIEWKDHDVVLHKDDIVYTFELNYLNNMRFADAFGGYNVEFPTRSFLTVLSENHWDDSIIDFCMLNNISLNANSCVSLKDIDFTNILRLYLADKRNNNKFTIKDLQHITWIIHDIIHAVDHTDYIMTVEEHESIRYSWLWYWQNCNYDVLDSNVEVNTDYYNDLMQMKATMELFHKTSNKKVVQSIYAGMAETLNKHLHKTVVDKLFNDLDRVYLDEEISKIINR